MAKKALRRPVLPDGRRLEFFLFMQELTLQHGDPSVALLASRAGYSHQTIYRALTGSRLPSREVTAEIAKCLAGEQAAVRAGEMWARAVAEEREADSLHVRGRSPGGRDDSGHAANVTGLTGYSPGPPSTNKLRIRLLGATEVVFEGRPLQLGGPAQRAVFATLVLRARQTVPTSELIKSVWGDDPPATATDIVPSYLSRLRKALAPVSDLIRLLSARPGYRADLEPNLVDANQFRRLYSEAQRCYLGHESALAAVRLRAALDLWRGNSLALADVSTAGSLITTAASLQLRRLDALQMLASIELDSDRPAVVVDLLQDTVLSNPEHESLALTLMKALSSLGEVDRALDIYRRSLAALTEVGLSPSPGLRRAQADLRARE